MALCGLTAPSLETSVRIIAMTTARYVHWQDGEMWLGYLEEFPDYLTQGESLAELEENLRDLYRDLTSGEVPGVRRIAELSIG
jgi:hypothetical protein